jgi:tetratricopeptide (TPR) repeat protein
MITSSKRTLSSERPIRRQKQTPRRFAWLSLAVGALALGLWGVVHHPRFQEWRLARISLSQLRQESRSQQDDYQILYYLGRSLNARQQFAEAVPVLNHAAELQPDSARIRSEWARALLGSGNVSTAYRELAQFAGTHPASAEAHFLLGKFYATQHAMARAREELEKATGIDPDQAAAWAYLADAREELGDLAGARQAAVQAIARRPGRAEDHLRLALLLAGPDRNPEAQREFARATQLAPENAVAHREFARWLLAQARAPAERQTALAEARRAEALRPQDPQTQLVLGRAFAALGQPDAAAGPLQRAAEQLPGDADAARELAAVLGTLGRSREQQRWDALYRERVQFASTLKSLAEQLRAAPDAREPHRRLARLLALHGDTIGCLRNAAAALRCPVDSPPALAAAANALTDGGHADRALSLARRAVTLARSSPTAHQALGNAQLGLGKEDEAVREYRLAASGAPMLRPEIEKRLARFRAAQSVPKPR